MCESCRPKEGQITVEGTNMNFTRYYFPCPTCAGTGWQWRRYVARIQEDNVVARVQMPCRSCAASGSLPLNTVIRKAAEP